MLGLWVGVAFEKHHLGMKMVVDPEIQPLESSMDYIPDIRTFVWHVTMAVLSDLPVRYHPGSRVDSALSWERTEMKVSSYQ